MNRTEVVEKISAHLNAQIGKAVQDKCCGYLTSHGLKCSIGCLLTDSICAKCDEDSIQPGDFYRYPDIMHALIQPDSCDLLWLHRIQDFHDDWALFDEILWPDYEFRKKFLPAEEVTDAH